MPDGYKQPITSTYEARWNLCREIDEFGAPGTLPMTVMLFYFMSSAWWGDKYGKKEQGLVVANHASPKEVMRFTGLSRAAVYKALTQLQESGWIDAREVRRGEVEVVILLDRKSRDARIRERAKSLQERQKVSHRDKLSPTETNCLQERLATVTDLRKRA